MKKLIYIILLLSVYLGYSQTEPINPESITVNSDYTFPTSDGTNGQVLQTNGSGTVSFATPSTLPTGTNNNVLTSDGSGGAVSEANLNFDGTNLDIAGAGTVIVGGLTASRLVATDASKNLVSTITSANVAGSVGDETGSGALMFGTSPTTSGITITGSPTASGATWTSLGTVTTGDWNGGTIDGTDIGLSSQGTGAFTTISGTTLATSSTVTLTNGNSIITNSSGRLNLTHSSASPTIRFIDGSDADYFEWVFNRSGDYFQLNSNSVNDIIRATKAGDVLIQSGNLSVSGTTTLTTLSGTATQLGGFTSGNVATTVTIGSGLSLSSGTLSASGGVTSGTHTPTTSGLTNVSSTSNENGTYISDGTIVTYNFMFTITYTGTGSWVVEIDLPVSSNFTAAEDAIGSYQPNNADITAYGVVQADATNDTIKISGTRSAGTGATIRGTVQYQIK